MSTQMDQRDAQAAVQIHPETRSVMRSAQARRLLEGPVLPTLLRLAAPTIALMLLQGVIASAEAAFVGRLGPDALAGVSVSFPMVMLMTTLSAGAFGGGIASNVARALGAGRSEEAGRHAGTALSLAVLLGIGTTGLLLFFGRSIYTALGVTGEALEAAVLYSDILFLGAVPFWLFNAAASILRGSGNTAYPAAVGAIGGILTLVVSPVIIFGLGYGIAGAAWAVVGYNVGMAIVLLRAVLSPTSAVRIPKKALRLNWRSVFEILRISIPSAASTIITNMTFIILVSLVAPFGVEATAGYGAGGRLEYLLIPIVFGVGSAIVPLVAASEGAGNFARVQQLTRVGAALGAGACGIVGTVAACFPFLWMELFTDDANVIHVGQAYLQRVGPAYTFLGLGLSLYFAAQGRGRTTQPLLATLTRLLVAGIGGWAIVSSRGAGLEVLFNLMAGGLAMYGLVMVVVMRRELAGRLTSLAGTED